MQAAGSRASACASIGNGRELTKGLPQSILLLGQDRSEVEDDAVLGDSRDHRWVEAAQLREQICRPELPVVDLHQARRQGLSWSAAAADGRIAVDDLGADPRLT